MLLQLNIRDIALIDEVNIELGSGLNILTGETGAGKSIIIDSINAVLGDRVSKEIIRTGSDKAVVEAVFQADGERVGDILGEIGIEPEEDGTLILSREITQSGRNTCRVNGKLVATSFLKSLGERLIDLHGQHDNQSLLRVESHIDLLDSFGGDAIQTIKRDYTVLLEQYREVRARLKALSGDPGERERKIDLLRFQIDEIKKAKLKPGEEDELNKQKTLLANSEKISEALSMAYGLLSSGESGKRPAADMMNGALSQLGSVARLEVEFDELYKRLQDIIYQLDDLTTDIRKSIDNVEYDPAQLEEIDERLDLFFKLKRKYGSTVEEVQRFCAAAQEQLEEMEKSEETANLLRSRQAELDGRLFETSCRLNDERRKAASLLEESIGLQLDDLEMKRARFKVDIQFDDTPGASGSRKYTQNGLNRVEFLISANPGEPLKPLAKIASGGEMSRIMLAIKTILADVDKMPTMIFDEIDIGISGKAGQKVGEKLAYISDGHQVICVTHLAQIACMAGSHYLIEKVSEENSTRTTVGLLDRSRKIKEIARLIGGSEASSASLKYAEEMINNAKKINNA
ncbi:MAG TPA: DNA repair protein RecN [Clostridia bacterium]|nr:DNA repair protein RecN [Clostridia bacterium]